MLVWTLVIGYCVWSVVAPRSVLRAFEWQMGHKPRFGETAIRVGSLLFMAFLIVLLMVTRR
jgi:hypothetical protein